MPTQNIGRISVVPKGEYNATTTYVPLDVVSYNGSSYIVKANVTGVAPPNAIYYVLNSARGIQGEQGIQGIPGEVLGFPTGGTTGQVLAKSSDANYDTHWVDGGGGLYPQFVITAPIGSVMTATRGQALITKTVVTSPLIIDATAFGTWLVGGNYQGTDFPTQYVNVDSVRQYPLEFALSKTFSVIIDELNQNPLTCCTYADDAVGMVKGASAWDTMDIFKDIRPCLLTSTDGVPSVSYLNPDNFTQYADGTPADITSGNAGDVMIEFKNKWGYKLERTGTNLKISVTSDPNATGYSYRHFSRDVEGDRNAFYVGAYHGYLSNNRLSSLSAKSPSVNFTIGNAINYCTNRGVGYKLWAFDMLTALQCLYIIKYGNLDSQTALGMGYVGGGAETNTGGTDTLGMYYGTTSSTQQIKLFGIEDFWGNVYDWIGGLFSDANRNIMTAFKDFNDTGYGYLNNGQGSASNISGYMSQAQGKSYTGFIAKQTSGSSTTYYCDNATLIASCSPRFGGSWSFGADAGAFRLSVNGSASNAYAAVGARLSYA